MSLWSVRGQRPSWFTDNEYQTHGVPVIGYGTDELPAFWSRQSGLKLHDRVDSAEDAPDHESEMGFRSLRRAYDRKPCS